jgi:hypothetical protein
MINNKGVHAVLGFRSFFVFLILFMPAIVVGVTHVGIFINGIVIGALPYVWIYIWWLTAVLGLLRTKIPMTHARVFKVNSTDRLLRIALFALLPAYLVVLNLLFEDKSSAKLLFLSLIIGLGIIYTLIVGWITVSRCTHSVLRSTDYVISFRDYAVLFFLFAMGPLTIWFLQPKIRRIYFGNDGPSLKTLVIPLVAFAFVQCAERKSYYVSDDEFPNLQFTVLEEGLNGFYLSDSTSLEVQVEEGKITKVFSQHKKGNILQNFFPSHNSGDFTNCVNACVVDKGGSDRNASCYFQCWSYREAKKARLIKK